MIYASAKKFNHMHSIKKNKKSTTSMVLVSLTIGHPCIAISQTNNSWKEKVNENLVCLICPNITIKAK